MNNGEVGGCVLWMVNASYINAKQADILMPHTYVSGWRTLCIISGPYIISAIINFNDDVVNHITEGYSAVVSRENEVVTVTIKKQDDSDGFSPYSNNICITTT